MTRQTAVAGERCMAASREGLACGPDTAANRNARAGACGRGTVLAADMGEADRNRR